MTYRRRNATDFIVEELFNRIDRDRHHEQRTEHERYRHQLGSETNEDDLQPGHAALRAF